VSTFSWSQALQMQLATYSRLANAAGAGTVANPLLQLR
jgi:hypothetical protein